MKTSNSTGERYKFWHKIKSSWNCTYKRSSTTTISISSLFVEIKMLKSAGMQENFQHNIGRLTKELRSYKYYKKASAKLPTATNREFRTKYLTRIKLFATSELK